MTILYGPCSLEKGACGREVWWAGQREHALEPFTVGFGGLVFKAHRLVYHSTLGLRVIKMKKKNEVWWVGQRAHALEPFTAGYGFRESWFRFSVKRAQLKRVYGL